MSREKYCKFCGRELEEGKCSCNAFLISQSKNKKPRRERTYIICDTCKSKVENDSNYCTNCGLPVHADGNIEKLQKELQGLGAPDVIEVYTAKSNKQNAKRSYSIPLVAMVALATFVFGIAIGLVIKPKIDSFIRNMAIKNSLAMEETAISTTTIDETTTINGPIVHEEILSPTAGTKKEKQDKTNELTSNNENNTNDNIDSSTYIEEIENDSIETAEGTISAEESTTNNKKNLIDKTTKVEKTTITKEDETEETIETSIETDGIIKGVDSDKSKLPLYVKSLRSIRDTLTKDGDTCIISYYAPVIAGIDPNEVAIANAAYTKAFDVDFLKLIKSYMSSLPELPKSIIFTEIEQKSSNSTRLNIIVRGKITPKTGLTTKIRYRAPYERKSQTIKVERISE